jgi:Kef-type K+ transport system membrane component KefB
MKNLIILFLIIVVIGVVAGMFLKLLGIPQGIGTIVVGLIVGVTIAIQDRYVKNKRKQKN